MTRKPRSHVRILMMYIERGLLVQPFQQHDRQNPGFEISLFWFSQAYINFTFILRQLKGNHNNIKATTKTVACSRLQDSVHAHLIFAWLVLFLAASLLSKNLAQATRSANSYAILTKDIK